MNAQTEIANLHARLKVELFWATHAFLAATSHTSKGEWTDWAWETDAVCKRLEMRIAYLEDMHGAHTMAPVFPALLSDTERLVGQARALWAERRINKATENAMWSLAWDLESRNDEEQVDGETMQRYLWASTAEGDARDAKRNAYDRHNDLCASIFR